MPRLRRLAALVAIGVGLVIGFTTSPATAQVPERPFARQATEPTAAVDDFVPIIKVSGLLDPIVADYIERTITAAENDGALYLVMQFNSGGEVLTRERFVRLAERVRDAKVPIGVWVGPSGAKARGGAAQLALLADTIGIAPKSRLGSFGPSTPRPGSVSDNAHRRDRRAPTQRHDRVRRVRPRRGICRADDRSIPDRVARLPHRDRHQWRATDRQAAHSSGVLRPAASVEPAPQRRQRARRLSVVLDRAGAADLRVLHGGCRHCGVRRRGRVRAGLLRPRCAAGALVGGRAPRVLDVRLRRGRPDGCAACLDRHRHRCACCSGRSSCSTACR